MPKTAPVDIDTFYENIAARLDEAIEIEPEEAAHGVLGALSSRLTHEEALELAGELPDEAADMLAEAAGELPFDRDAFIEDVASRLDLDDEDAERVAVAVLGAVRDALEPSPEQVIETLPSDLARLMHASE